MELAFGEHWYRPVHHHPDGVRVGDAELRAGDAVAGSFGALRAADLRDAARAHERLLGRARPPQLAALAFEISGSPAALHGYFPLTGALGDAERAAFDGRLRAAVERRELDVRLYAEGALGGVREVAAPRAAAGVVAGQLVELFFYRRGLLEALLASRPRVWLYATGAAFARHGGVGGGCYSPARGGIQLVLARLFEGFDGPTPGVCPLLHELGHLLDCFDPVRGAQGLASGLYPGLRPGDGEHFLPEARALFLRGKRLELERYLLRYEGRALPEHPLPIGHPYVFQNDGEFLAGYLELFMRSPHGVAALNPELFAAYAALFGQDPRRAWGADFGFYLDQNRRFYQESGERPWPPGLTSPA